MDPGAVGTMRAKEQSMSFATRLARQLGLNRVSVDTPLSQDQRTPLLPSTAIRPLDALTAVPTACR